MNPTLSYEDWKEHQHISVSERARVGLARFHNLDADKEIEAIMKQLYQQYLDENAITTKS